MLGVHLIRQNSRYLILNDETGQERADASSRKFGKNFVNMRYNEWQELTHCGMGVPTVLRAEEIAALKLADVQADDGTVRDEFALAKAQTIGRKARRVFVSAKLKRELSLYLKQVDLRKGCDALFQSQKGAAFSANTMCQLFLNIYKECGIDGASSHSGRRSLLTNLASRGVGLRVLA